MSLIKITLLKAVDVVGAIVLWPILRMMEAIGRKPSQRYASVGNGDHEVRDLATAVRRSALAPHFIRLAILYLLISVIMPGGWAKPDFAEATGPPSSVTVSEDTAATVGELVTVTATALDTLNNAAVGYNVTVTVTGPGATVTTGITGFQGEVEFTFNSPDREAMNTFATSPGTSTVTITVWESTFGPELSQEDSTIVQWAPSVRDHYTINVASPQHTDQCFPVDLSVRDSFENLVSDDPDHTATVTSSGSVQFHSNSTCTSSLGSTALVPMSSGEGGTFAKSSTPDTVTFSATSSDAPVINGTSSEVEIQGDVVTYTVVPSSTAWTAGEGVSVTVTGFDADGAVVTTDSSTVVTMTSSNGSIEFDANNDESFGDVSAPLSSGQLVLTARGTIPSSPKLIATDESGASGESEPVTVVAGPPSEVFLTPGSSTNVVDTPHTVTATVTDKGGNPIDGVTVTFTVEGTRVEQGLSDDEPITDNGVATFTFKSTRTGVSDITATIEGGEFATATKTWVGAAPETIVLSPTNETNGTGVSQTVMADVRDEFDNPVADGTEVTFFASGTGSETPTPKQVTTTDGFAVYMFTSTQTGVSEVTATSGEAISNEVTFTWVPGPPAIIEIDPPDDTNMVDEGHTVTATVKDVGGNQVADGHTITFTMSGTGGEVKRSDATPTTKDGIVTFTFSSTKTGTSIVTATGEIGEGTATKNWTPGPFESLTLEPPFATNGVGQPHTVTATLRDEFDNPSGDGVLVTFTVIGSGETSGNDTSSGGIASFTFTSEELGRSTITATAAGPGGTLTSNQVIKDWEVGPPEEIIVSPSSDSNRVDTNHTVTATVRDEFDNLATDGTPVSFTVSGTGGEENRSDPVTNTIGGVATFTFSSTRTGTTSIIAQSGDAQGSASKTWTPGDATTISAAPTSATNNLHRNHAVVATVRDEFGNVAGSGIPVTFTASGTGGESPSSAVIATNNGVATFNFTSSKTGTSSIVAKINGDQATVSKTWVQPGPDGYWMAAADGGIFAFGEAPFHGSMGGMPLNQPIVGIAATPGGNGYWMVAADGGIFSFGNAQFFGSMGGTPLNQPIVGMAALPNGDGYWMVAADGGIFSFGNAQFFGSMGGTPLNQPIVGMAAMPSGDGYWMVAADGGIFTFGSAPFHGSMGGTPLNQRIVGMDGRPTGNGYWMVAADGGIFSFGDAAFHGSMGGTQLNKPVVGMAATPSGNGYWMVGSDGGVFSFGDAVFWGSTGDIQLNQPIVAITELQ